MLKLSFEYFTDKEKFFQIKREFLFKDYRFDYPEAHISQVNLEHNDIEYVRKISDDETDVLTLNFYVDYIPPSIIKISDKYKKKFIKTFDGNYSLLETGEDKFKRIELQKLNDISQEIKVAPHLIDSLKDTLIKAIEELCGFINAYKQNEVKDKIPFNLGKNEVITLFHLLYQKGYISQELDKKDISRLIGRNFEYFNKKEKKYMPVIRTGKQENNLLTDKGDDNPSFTLKKLKNLFTADDFFNLDITLKRGDKKSTP